MILTKIGNDTWLSYWKYPHNPIIATNNERQENTYDNYVSISGYLK